MRFADDNRRPIDELRMRGDHRTNTQDFRLSNSIVTGPTAAPQFSEHPLTEISLKCGGPYNPHIASVVGWHDGPSPPEPWFTLAMLAGNAVNGAQTLWTSTGIFVSAWTSPLEQTSRRSAEPGCFKGNYSVPRIPA